MQDFDNLASKYILSSMPWGVNLLFSHLQHELLKESVTLCLFTDINTSAMIHIHKPSFHLNLLYQPLNSIIQITYSFPIELNLLNLTGTVCVSWADFHALCIETCLSILLCKMKCVPIVSGLSTEAQTRAV